MNDPLERRINRAVYEQDVAASRRAGAEEMREKAAKYLDDSAEKHEAAAKRYNLTRSDVIAEQQRNDARAIRALPVE